MNKKGKVNGKIYDIISPEEFCENPALYENGFVAIENNGLLYPVRKNNRMPGYFQKNQAIGIYVNPTEEDREDYLASNTIDFSSAKTMQDIIEKKAEYTNMEREILCDPDNIFHPVIRDDDAPEMRLLKEAVTLKNIDLNKYESRFGSTFSNDKRLFNNSSITLAKLKTVGNVLDIKVSLILEDKNSTVSNPIGQVLSIDITGGEELNDE